MVCIHLDKRIGNQRVIGRLSKKGEVRKAVQIALQTGYTHIDCAHIYGNEDEVGLGIKDWGGNRKKIWVTSSPARFGEQSRGLLAIRLPGSNSPQEPGAA